jgi:hypothetical protein
LLLRRLSVRVLMLVAQCSQHAFSAESLVQAIEQAACVCFLLWLLLLVFSCRCVVSRVLLLCVPCAAWLLRFLVLLCCSCHVLPLLPSLVL